MTDRAEIRLREWQEEDLTFLLELRNDVDLQAKLLSTVRGSKVADVRKWASRRSEDPNQVFHIIADARTNCPIGYLQAERQSENPNDWKFGICLGGTSQGRGLGGEAMRALERHLISKHTAARLTLIVDTLNARAISCYQKLGYSATKRPLEPVLVCDEFREVIEMERLLNDGAHSS